MKILKPVFLVIFILIFLQACSGITVSQDYEQGYDFSTLKTFSWKANDNNEYGLEDNDLVDNRIREAIESQLSAKSFTRVDTGKPDFYVSYHVTIEQKVSSSNVSGGVSIGRSSRGRYGSIGMGTGSAPRVYDQGTLLIDFTGSANDKLIWRGISTQSVSDHLEPGESKVIINETVEKILQQFPPKQ
jgi:hypothetical protein